MRRAHLALMVALAACGDNVVPVGAPLGPAATVAIVAHQDDDLLFMQPDLLDVVANQPVTIVYVTAGDDGRGLDYSERRYAALQATYSATTAVAEPWRCGWIMIAGHAAEHCRLDAAQLSLVYLGYPDGGKQGQLAGSLLSLWEGKIERATTIAGRAASYDQEGLVATLAEVITTAKPQVIRTLEVASTHGTDHSDHMLVGALAVLARARAASDAELVAHRGYDVKAEAVDLAAPVATIADDAFARYLACAEGCAPCGQACPMIGSSYASWLERRYAVGIARHTTGAVTADGGATCLATNPDGSVVMATCDAASSWQLAHDGLLHVGDRCLAAAPAGALSATTCDQATPVAYDDEGHLWLAIAPAPQPAMDLAHLGCIAVVAGVPVAQLCGAPSAPTWTIEPAIVTTSRAALGITATGRAVRIGDVTGDGKADLCAVGPGGLLCAAGDGTGGFAPALRIDAPSAPLAIEPESLALGDIDGDGRLDACGRDASGILCATAASGFVAMRFATAFASAGPADASDRSLTVIDPDGNGIGAVCGLMANGVGCVARDAHPVMRSHWPGSGAPLWIADLDGDHLADWCSATAAGPACGRASDRAVSTDGVSWGFSWMGVVEGSTAAGAIATADTSALADIDGDGRADLCVLDGTSVMCAPSQGAAFGPRFPLVAFQTAPTALWLGDLDGDGTADACVDLGDAIACAISSTARGVADRRAR